MKDLKKWIKIRQDLYRQLQAEVSYKLGGETLEMEKYRREYENSLKKKWVIIERSELLSELQNRKFLLFGDFHALQQSQKTILRVLKQIKVKSASLLGVEFFKAEDQNFLDLFIAGRLSEERFLKEIEWTKNWEFPWENYKPIIEWAKNNKVRIVGLNHKDKKKSLKERDEYSASVLLKYLTAENFEQVFIVYGDWHISKEHFPKVLNKKIPKEKLALIHQNAESIYFQMMKNNQLSDIIRFNKNEYCLQSIPPWVKWQSYLIFLDHLTDQEEEETLDYTDLVCKYVKLISDELELEISNSDLSVYSANDSDLWDKVEVIGEKYFIKNIQQLVEDRVSFYLPKYQWGYLARPTVNHIASLAMQFVHSKLAHNEESSLKMPADFRKLIWLEAVAYFGSKMINPKRKCDSVVDLKAHLSLFQGDIKIKESYSLALFEKMQEIKALRFGGDLKCFPAVKYKASYLRAAFLLGGMLGEKMFHGYKEKYINSKDLVKLFSKSLSFKNFDVFYLDTIETIESFPDPFRSKVEKI